MAGTILGESELRASYPAPGERARRKTLTKLDRHCRAFIERSPFVCLGTSSGQGADVTPRGDRPGFVQVLNDVTLAIPDWPGNNRLDTLGNILANPQVAMLFLIPGVEESLRVNGDAEVSTDPELLNRWKTEGKVPRSVVLVTVREAFLHCGKALIRSKLWKDDYKIQRSELPSYGQMLKEQTGVQQTAAEIDAAIAEGYAKGLY